MATKNKAQVEVIEGVLVYCKVAEPSRKYESKDTEFSVGILVDEDTADAWEERFKKQAAKKIKASEFEDRFKFPLPDCFKGEKNVFQITLKRDCVVDGEEVFPETFPKVFLDTVEDGEEVRIEITKSRLVANGSVGKVSYRVTSNSFGTFARLQNILIDEDNFIEYESTGRGAGSEFGGGKKVKVEPENKAATEARKRKEEAAEDSSNSGKEPEEAAKPSKPRKTTKPPVEDDAGTEDDSPF